MLTKRAVELRREIDGDRGYANREQSKEMIGELLKERATDEEMDKMMRGVYVDLSDLIKLVGKYSSSKSGV